MPDRPIGGPRRRAAALGALLTVLALATGCGADPSAPSPGQREKAGPVAVLADRTPKALEVPSIGVHTSTFVHIGLAPNGKMEVPKDAVTAGWFDLGPVPGDLGPAVIAAHVNYKKVAGVFERLHEVAVGDAVSVTRADGRVVTFTAYRVERYAKAEFPTQQVYGNTAGPELRLVTCGGDFDTASGHYRDNVVVFARAA